jgi:mono/diheme cytochrome c family protein
VRRTVFLLAAGAAAALLMLAGAGIAYVKSTGLTTRGEPGRLEAAVAIGTRRFSIPAAARQRANPVAPTPDAIADGLAHFADHCASCHANDGSGNTELGRAFFPKAPDMRRPATQQLTDGELFYVIENGIRFTGMPAWGTGTAEGEESSWRLVHFIRRLPQLTEEDIASMAALNPRPPAEIRRQIEEERFLSGETPDTMGTP